MKRIELHYEISRSNDTKTTEGVVDLCINEDISDFNFIKINKDIYSIITVSDLRFHECDNCELSLAGMHCRDISLTWITENGNCSYAAPCMIIQDILSKDEEAKCFSRYYSDDVYFEKVKFKDIDSLFMSKYILRKWK